MAAQRAATQLAAEADIRVVAIAAAVAAQRGQIATLERELASARKAAAARAARAAAELQAFEQHLDVVQGEADRQRASLRSKLDELTRAHSELERERSELSKLKRKCRQVNRRCDELERLSASRSFRFVHRLWAIRARARSMLRWQRRSHGATQ